MKKLVLENFNLILIKMDGEFACLESQKIKNGLSI